MSKQVSTGLIVALMVLVAGLVITGFPLSAYTAVAVIFAICAGYITWIYMRTSGQQE